jgi:hypothetical protein
MHTAGRLKSDDYDGVWGAIQSWALIRNDGECISVVIVAFPGRMRPGLHDSFRVQFNTSL